MSDPRADAGDRAPGGAGSARAAAADASTAALPLGADAATVDLRRPVSSPARPARGKRIAGRYELLGALGAGGNGVVYEALDPELGRRVAVKVLRLERAAVERLQREGELAARLEHPGIVRVYSAGEDRGRPYLVLELVEGARPLTDALPERELAGRVEWVIAAAEAVGHAHRRGVVHRDLKPANLLVDGEGRLRVTDFGLAHAADLERLTETGGAVGTPAFMPPELLRGERAVGPTADVWALGVVLHLVLAGRLPFPGPTLGALRLQHRTGAPPLPTAPPALAAVARRALALDPAARYADGAALAAALRGALTVPWRAALARPGVAAPALAAALLLLATLIAGALALELEPAPPPPAWIARLRRVLEGGEEQLPSPEQLQTWRARLDPGQALAGADHDLELVTGLRAFADEQPERARLALVALEAAPGPADPRTEALRGLLELADPTAPLPRALARLGRARARLSDALLARLEAVALSRRVAALLELGERPAPALREHLRARGPRPLGDAGAALAQRALARVAPLLAALERDARALGEADLDLLLDDLELVSALDRAALPAASIGALARRLDPLGLPVRDLDRGAERVLRVAELAPDHFDAQSSAVVFHSAFSGYPFEAALAERFLATLRRAVALAPADLRKQLRFLLIRRLDERGRSEEALALAAALAPELTDPIERAALAARRGVVLLRLGRYAEAERELAEAVKVAATSDVHLYYAITLRRQGRPRERVLEVLEAYFASADVAPIDSSRPNRALAMLWDVALPEERVRLVRAPLEQVLARSPFRADLAGWWARRAEVERAAGEPSRARECARRALELARAGMDARWHAAFAAACEALEREPLDPAPLQSLIEALDRERRASSPHGEPFLP